MERLYLFGNDVAVNMYYTFLDYTPISTDGTDVEGAVAQRAVLMHG